MSIPVGNGDGIEPTPPVQQPIEGGRRGEVYRNQREGYIAGRYEYVIQPKANEPVEAYQERVESSITRVNVGKWAGRAASAAGVLTGVEFGVAALGTGATLGPTIGIMLAGVLGIGLLYCGIGYLAQFSVGNRHNDLKEYRSEHRAQWMEQTMRDRAGPPPGGAPPT